jgi:cold shock CspA family protein
MFGRIKHKTLKGFAFIRQQQVGNEPIQDVFLHRTEFQGDWDTLKVGELIQFTPGIKEGRPQAFDAHLVAGGAE